MGTSLRTGLTAILLVGLVATLPAPGGAAEAAPNPCVGTIEERPNSTTYVTIQGVGPDGKTPGMLVAFGPNGSVDWVRNNSHRGGRWTRWWTYDVDPLPDGTLLLATTERNVTVVEEIDPRTNEQLWVERFDSGERWIKDAHDVDYIGDGEYVFADKREGGDRLVVYNRTRDEITWDWRFAEHGFEHEDGGSYPNDWTHVNDVDRIGEDVYMASVRNFDQVIAVNRTTGNVVWQLGVDNRHSIMNEQHNPQYLVGENGTPTVLIADSLNDRVVEYSYDQDLGEWQRTWTLVGGGLDEPRDADRLPNGNTLVVDRMGHRTMEVTPSGRVVWEVYTPWEPYDVERARLGDEPGGPTSRDLGADQRVRLTNSAGFDRDAIRTCASALERFGRTRTDGLGTVATPDPRFVADRNRRQNDAVTPAGVGVPEQGTVDDWAPVVLGLGLVVAIAGWIGLRRRSEGV